MPSWKNRLSAASRDKRTLVRAAGLIAAASIILALLVDVVWRQAPPAEGDSSVERIGGLQLGDRISVVRFSAVQQDLKVPKSLDDETLIWFFVNAANLYGPGGVARPGKIDSEERGDLLGRAGKVVVGEFLEKSELSPGSQRAFDLWARGVFLSDEEAESSRASLNELAKTDGAPKYTNMLLADLLARVGDPAGAMDAIEVEGKSPHDEEVRRVVVRSALKKGDKDTLERVIENPDFESSLDWRTRHAIAKETRDYLGLLRTLFMVHVASPPSFLFVILTLVGGAAWFAIIVGFIGFSGHRWWLFLIPVAAGVLSVVPTLLFLILQEDFNGMKETGVFPTDLVYWIAGVGLREEVGKLLLFALFVPFLLKKRSAAHALITAACVGLGFAIEENISYYHRTLELAAMGLGSLGTEFARYITATCIHMFLSGILGYAFYWFCISPKRYWEQFLVGFLFAVIMHGLYDFVLSPSFGDFAQKMGGVMFDQQFGTWLAIILIAVCSFRFFHLVDISRLQGRRLISPLGLFVIGGAVIYGSALMVACTMVPFETAFKGSTGAGLNIALVAWIYINRFRDE